MAKTSLKDQIELFKEHGIFLPRRTVKCFGEITREKCDEIIENLHALDYREGRITVLLNSIGGCVRSAWGIYDAIRGCKNTVHVMTYGECMSSATIILQAGDKRFSAPHTQFMIHYGENERPEDHVLTNRKWAEQDDADCREMEDFYLERIREKKPKFTKAKVKKMLEFDSIYNAKEFLELGLIDDIMEQYE